MAAIRAGGTGRPRHRAHCPEVASPRGGGYADTAATDPAAGGKAEPAARRGTATPNRTATVPPATAGGTPTTARGAATRARGARTATRGTRTGTGGTRTATRGTRIKTRATATRTGDAAFPAAAAGPCPARAVRQEPRSWCSGQMGRQQPGRNRLAPVALVADVGEGELGVIDVAEVGVNSGRPDLIDHPVLRHDVA
jgi:hypothetical protein